MVSSSGGADAFGDTILFTTDEDILERVAENDETYEGEALSADQDVFDSLPIPRPPTSDTEQPLRPFTSPANAARTKRESFKQVCSVGDLLGEL